MIEKGQTMPIDKKSEKRFAELQKQIDELLTLNALLKQALGFGSQGGLQTSDFRLQEEALNTNPEARSLSRSPKPDRN